MAHPIVDVHLSESAPKELLLTRHAEFLSLCENKYDCTLDYLRLSGVYWTLTALDLIGELKRIESGPVIELVIACHNTDGGFSSAPGHDSHLLSTLSAIQILALFNELGRIDAGVVTEFVLRLQQPDGSFCGDKWGEVDTRFSFCGIASLKLLGSLDECVANGQLNTNLCAEYLQKCQNFDGGFGTRPGSESHAGQAYCVVGALSILKQLRRLNLERAAWWLAERQLPSGGLNGRPEKKPDVCYSWWIVATLTILGRLVWIDERKLVHFILASQDSTTGGIADRPGDYPDPFHTLFGLAGISLVSQAHEEDSENPVNHQSPSNNGFQSNSDMTMADELLSTAIISAKQRLKPINPVFCLPQYVIERMQLDMQLIE